MKFSVSTPPKTRIYKPKLKPTPALVARPLARMAPSFPSSERNEPQGRPLPAWVAEEVPGVAGLAERVLKAERAAQESVGMFTSLIFETRPTLEESRSPKTS
jgi:hypothetical protein